MQDNENRTDDPLWNLLDNASEQKADHLFSRNVMRQIRLDESEKKPWWSAILRPAPILGTLATAACVALIITAQPENPALKPAPIVHSPEDRFEELVSTLETDEELDSLMNPISLVAFSEAELSDFDYLLGF